MEKAAAAHAYDDYKIDSSSCAAANSSNEASIWGTCQKEKRKSNPVLLLTKGKGLRLYVAVLTQLCRMFWTMEMRVMLCVVHVLSGQVIPFNRMELKMG